MALVARREDRLAVQVEKIQRRGGHAIAVAMDVCDETNICRALEQIERDFVPVDVLINNAGIAIDKTFLETDNRDWNSLMDTNVIGLAAVARETAQRMIIGERNGAIINIGSILGIRAGNLAAAYAASTKAYRGNGRFGWRASVAGI